jgi:ADP-heptose:LPS heptosyltransferase
VKILIIKFGALGDIILATPLLRGILGHHRGDAVTLLTSPAFAPLFQDWPGLSVEARPRRGLVAFWRTLCWIRAQGFSRLIDLQSNDRSGLLSALSGIPERIGNHPRFPYHRHPPDRYTGQCHAYERLNQVLQAGGMPPAAGPPDLPAPAPVQGQIRDWLAMHGLSPGAYVLLHAGSSHRHAGKRWPYYGELAESLAARGLTPVWIGGREDRELNRALAQRQGLDATGLFSILELAELGRHAAFAVTNDSAPMHILACSGIPVYGLFGPTDWRRTHALGQAQHVIAAAEGELARLSADTVLARLQADGRLH